MHVSVFACILLTGMDCWSSSARRIIHLRIVFSTRLRYHNLYRFGYLNQLLPDVAAFQHAYECYRSIFKAIYNRLSVF